MRKIVVRGLKLIFRKFIPWSTNSLTESKEKNTQYYSEYLKLPLVSWNHFSSTSKIDLNCKEILLKYVSSKFPNHEAWQASSLRSALYSWSLNRQHDEDTASGLVCVGGSGLLPEAGQPIQGVPEWSKETQVFWQQQTNMCVPWWNCSRQVQGKSSWNNK